jgi:type IV secretion system protein VirD4
MTEIFTGMRRGVPGMSPREMQPPAMVFEEEESVAGSSELRMGPGKILLGVVGARVEEEKGKSFTRGGRQIGATPEGHLCTIAGSGAGKGRGCLAPALFLYEGSCLVIDPKGELALITAKARAKKQKVFVLDPFNTTERKLPANFYAGFNPMSHMQAASSVEDVTLITDALVLPEGTRDPHWNESAKTFIEGVIMEVFTAPRFEGKRNLVTARDLIAEGDKSVTPEEMFDKTEDEPTALERSPTAPSLAPQTKGLVPAPDRRRPGRQRRGGQPMDDTCPRGRAGGPSPPALSWGPSSTVGRAARPPA